MSCPNTVKPDNLLPGALRDHLLIRIQVRVGSGSRSDRPLGRSPLWPAPEPGPRARPEGGGCSRLDNAGPSVVSSWTRTEARPLD